MERMPDPYVGDPCDRQLGESDVQFARFNAYLDVDGSHDDEPDARPVRR